MHLFKHNYLKLRTLRGTISSGIETKEAWGRCFREFRREYFRQSMNLQPLFTEFTLNRLTRTASRHVRKKKKANWFGRKAAVAAGGECVSGLEG